MKKFKSTILILPGLGNSGEQHWQSLWEKQHPEVIRVNQDEWDAPRRMDWVNTLNQKINEYEPSEIILVAHSLACATVAFWAREFKTGIKAALLVAPSDTEAATYEFPVTGFQPIPLEPLPFRSIVVAGSDDFYVTAERAHQFAECWKSELVVLENAGHINAAAGFGEWSQGLELLKKLDE